MSPDQIALVQDSFKDIVPIKDLAAKIFYERLFELDPGLKPLFTTSLHQQGQKLMSAMAMIVGGLRSWERIEPAVREMGQRHVGYGVKPEHYDTVGAALIWALEHALADGFTDEVKAAWTTAYESIAGTMVDAARTQAA